MTPKKVQKKLSKKVKLSFISKLRKYIPLILLLVTIMVLIVYPKPKSTYNPNPSPSIKASPKASNVPLPSPSQPPKNLKKETIRRENPDKTFAFYYSSDTPAFTHIVEGYEDDPFKLKLNGDTRYFTRGALKSGWNNKDTPILENDYLSIIKPKVINLKTSEIRELFSIDKGIISGIGFKNILNWVDSTHLLSQDCTEGRCNYDLIDVSTDKSSYFAINRSFPLSGYSGWQKIIHIKNYTFVQTRQEPTVDDSNLEYGHVKIFVNVPDRVIKNNEWESYFSTITPMQELKVAKDLNELSFSDENISTFNQKIKFYLSSIPQYYPSSTIDGYFIFDLQSGTVIEDSNL